MLDNTSLVITIIGAINWLSIGIFGFNIVNWITFGMVWLERLLYILVGVAGVFIETHEDPSKSPSDGPNMIPLADLKGVLTDLLAIDRLMKKY